MSKVSLKHHYSITDSPDGSKVIRVTDTIDGCPVEFDAINGNLFPAGDMSFDYDDIDLCDMTLAECKHYGKEFLIEWEIDEEIADAIIEDLTPWFVEHAISEKEAIRKKIADLKGWIEVREERIESNKRAIFQKESEIRIFTAKAETYITAHKSENDELLADILRFSERIRDLKSQLKKA